MKWKSSIPTEYYIINFLITSVHATTFFCDSSNHVTIDGFDNGSIVTRNDGTSQYANSWQCTWTIFAAEASEVIQVQVISSSLEWSPEGSICQGYDYVQIFDGPTEDSPELLTFCGEANPQFFTSTQPQLHIVFKTNDRNKFAFSGVQLDFTVVDRRSGLGSCPPGWHDVPTLPDGGSSCYTLRTHTETWIDALTHCNYDKANLVSINSTKEDAFIAELIANSSLGNQKVWLSLNDIGVDGVYRWLDGTKLTTNSRWRFPDKLSDSYSNCVTTSKAGLWELDFCNENDIQTTVAHAFICEKLKVGENTLYPRPIISSEEDSGEDRVSSFGSDIGLIVGCAVAGVVLCVLVVVTIVLVMKRKKKSRRPSSSTARTQRTAMRDLTTSRRNPRPPSNTSVPPGNQPAGQPVVVIHYEEPPPSYDKVVNK